PPPRPPQPPSPPSPRPSPPRPPSPRPPRLPPPSPRPPPPSPSPPPPSPQGLLHFGRPEGCFMFPGLSAANQRKYDFKLFPGPTTDLAKNFNPHQCEVAVREAGYMYVGIVAGRKCYGLNSLVPGFQLPDTACAPCVAFQYSRNACGSDSAMTIYDLGDLFYPPPSWEYWPPPDGAPDEPTR
ncbi:hypothetical protein Agub_g7727, partial [Astrephomene gubernaculifera]